MERGRLSSRLAVLAVLGCVSFAACLFPPTETLTGTGGGDAGPSLDGTASADSSADAGIDAFVDASEAGLCTGAVFCDDFERTTGVLGPWSSTQGSGGATLGLFSDGGTSLRYAYSGADATGGGPAAYVQKDGLTAPHALVEFDAFVDVGPGFFNVIGIQFHFGNNLVITGGYQIATGSGSASTQVYDFGTNQEISYTPGLFSKVPPQKKWFHGSLELRVVGTTGTTTATLDGVTVGSSSASNVGSGPVTVFAGCIYSSSPKGSGSILVDNVRVVALP